MYNWFIKYIIYSEKYCYVYLLFMKYINKTLFFIRKAIEKLEKQEFD